MIIAYVTPEGSVSSADSFDPELITLTPEATFQPDPVTAETSFDPDDLNVSAAFLADVLESEKRMKLLMQEIDVLKTQLREKDEAIDAQIIEIQMLESQLRAAV